MSYFDNLREEEYRRSYSYRLGRPEDESESDRFNDEPDSRVHRPRHAQHRHAHQDDSSTSRDSVSAKKSKKKKKKNIRRSTSDVIPESEPVQCDVVPSTCTVVRNDSQADSSMASESYTQRSTTMSSTSAASSNILEAYRKLKASQRSSSANSSTLPRHHEEGEHGSSSTTQTHDTPSSTQRTPATSSSTQMSTDDDRFLHPNNSRPSLRQRLPRHPQTRASATARAATTTTTTATKDLVPEYPPPPRPSTKQLQFQELEKSRSSEAVAQYTISEEPIKPKRKSVQNKTTKKRNSKRNSRTNFELSKQKDATTAPDPKHDLRQQAAQGIPVEQVYASYNREHPMRHPQQKRVSQSVLARNMALKSATHPANQPQEQAPPPRHPKGGLQDETQSSASEVPPLVGIHNRNNNHDPYRGPSVQFDKDASQESLDYLKQSVQNAELDPYVSIRMDEVKKKIRKTMSTDTTHHGEHKKKSRRKSRRAKDDASDASSSSSSSRGGILGFLSGFKGHPKSQMTESERRAAHNPFLNRPNKVNTYTTIGTFGNKGKEKGDDNSSASSDQDHARRHDVDDDDESYSSYSSESTKKKRRFPLPAPLRKVQQFCGRVVTNTSFQIFMIVLIMLNALVLGIATYDFDNPAIPKALDIIDRILLVIFTIELALQFGYCGYNLFLDGWLVFDTLTVVTSWWLEGVQVFRSFRIFRSFRLIVRLPLLKNLVLTVFHVMPRIYSILALLLLVLYVFGVLVTILYGDQTWGGVDYFGHLGLSIFTLFQMVTLEGWGEVVRLVAEEHKWSASIIFSVFIVVTGFIMYNLIVAVMCDSMLVIEAQGREELRQQQKEKKYLDEIAKQEEEQRLHEAMLAQRKAEGGSREHMKGVVNDDPTIQGIPLEETQGSDLSSYQSLSKGSDDEEETEEEEEVEMRALMCPNCEHCHQIPKYTASHRNRLLKREAAIAANQERARLLGQKVEQLAETQTRVTSVLQTLMFEIEASRQGTLNSDGGTFNLSMGDISLEDYQNR